MIQHFLDYIAIERKYSQRTVEAYRDDLRDFCTFLGWDPKDFNPDELDETDVKNWMLFLLEEQHQSPRSVKRRLSALRSFYKFLLRQKKVTKDITARVVPPKADKPLPVFFRNDEMDAAERLNEAASCDADSFEAVRDALIIEVFYQTGMRQAEMLGLQDRDWDLNQGQVRIFGKRRKERIVPVGESLGVTREMIHETMAELMAARIADDKTNLTTEEVRTLLRDGYHPRDVRAAGVLGKAAGKDAREILGMKKINNGWEDVAKELGLDAKVLREAFRHDWMMGGPGRGPGMGHGPGRGHGPGMGHREPIPVPPPQPPAEAE